METLMQLLLHQGLTCPYDHAKAYDQTLNHDMPHPIEEELQLVRVPPIKPRLSKLNKNI